MAAQSLFRSFCLTPVSLQTELLPYLAKLTNPMRNQGKAHGYTGGTFRENLLLRSGVCRQMFVPKNEPLSLMSQHLIRSVTLQHHSEDPNNTDSAPVVPHFVMFQF